VPLAVLRDRSSIVFQETFLFSLPVRENIAFRKPAASLKDVVAAAEAAQASGFIHRLKHGYKTLIGERGINLSGGQKQRVSIARSLLNSPDLLVLDAPSANLDAITEHKLEQTFFPRTGRTTLLISQRIASVRKADHIAVMDKGRIVGRGTHEELLERCGLYRAMYRSQFL
jgi:ATP-binding cassette subfamily B protein